MAGIYIAPLSKALYNLCLSFSRSHTHTHTHQRRLAAMQVTNQLVKSNWGLGVLLRDTSTCPGWDRTDNSPTARGLLLPLEPYRPYFRRMKRATEFVAEWKKLRCTFKKYIYFKRSLSRSSMAIKGGVGKYFFGRMWREFHQILTASNKPTALGKKLIWYN